MKIYEKLREFWKKKLEGNNEIKSLPEGQQNTQPSQNNEFISGLQNLTQNGNIYKGKPLQEMEILLLKDLGVSDGIIKNPALRNDLLIELEPEIESWILNNSEKDISDKKSKNSSWIKKQMKKGIQNSAQEIEFYLRKKGWGIAKSGEFKIKKRSDVSITEKFYSKDVDSDSGVIQSYKHTYVGNRNKELDLIANEPIVKTYNIESYRYKSTYDSQGIETKKIAYKELYYSDMGDAPVRVTNWEDEPSRVVFLNGALHASKNKPAMVEAIRLVAERQDEIFAKCDIKKASYTGQRPKESNLIINGTFILKYNLLENSKDIATLDATIPFLNNQKLAHKKDRNKGIDYSKLDDYGEAGRIIKERLGIDKSSKKELNK